MTKAPTLDSLTTQGKILGLMEAQAIALRFAADYGAHTEEWYAARSIAALIEKAAQHWDAYDAPSPPMTEE